MSKKIEFKNNYTGFQDDFKKDTGLNAKTNVETYIQYYNARINDMSYQLSWHGLELLGNKLDFLPDTIRLRIAEMIREHDTIKEFKQLLKK